jgi:alpha-galactosidase
MQLSTIDGFVPTLATFDGLDKESVYQVTVVEDLSSADFMQKQGPGWWPSVTMTGDHLAHIGLQLPVLKPESGLLFHFRAI